MELYPIWRKMSRSLSLVFNETLQSLEMYKPSASIQVFSGKINMERQLIHGLWKVER
jgi:hypothetical protein